MNQNNLLTVAAFSPHSIQFPNSWIGHLPFAAWIIREVRPKIFVELGTHSGNSYFSFCQAVVEAGIQAKCYAVDTWQGDEHAGQYSEEIFAQVHAHHQAYYAGFSRLLRTTFDDAVTYFADESIDLLHIDGLHTYDAIRHDFETWLPRLAPGAVVLFHDTNVRERNFGVWKLWMELQANYPNNLEFVHSHGLGVLQLNNAPIEKKLEWLQPDSSEKEVLKNYFAALGAQQLIRYDLIEQKQHAAHLNQAVAERDNQIANLTQAAADHNSQIVTLTQVMVEQDNQIANLTQAAVDNNNQIANLNQSLQECELRISATLASTSWRITHPVRWLGSQVKRISHVKEPVRPPILTGKSTIKAIDEIAKLSVEGGFNKAHQDVSPLNEDFDSEFYLKLYPDIACSGIDPLQHYLMHGRQEGRLASMPSILFQGAIETEFDPGRKNIIVVSHEASRSGAPVLSLNLVRVLQERYNILVLLLGGGPLIGSFRDLGAVVGQWDMQNNPMIAKLVLEQILPKCQFDFALVNSVVSWVVLPILAQHHIPSISLVHEFAAYIRPRTVFLKTLLWSGEAIFSSKLTLQNALDQFPELRNRVFPILPQGRCVLPEVVCNPGEHAVERIKLLSALKPHNRENGQPFIVLGAGYVQLRKGVDLFIDCAYRLLQSSNNLNIRFVWIGQGYDSENDAHYSVYLADQIERAGITQHITLIDATPNMDFVYQASDLLLLTSRLDPLPNVAIDALCEGLPVLCFEKTTGIADILIDEGLQEDCVADFLDTKMLAEKILRLANNAERYQKVSRQCKRLAASIFNMERYVKEIEKYAEATKIKFEQEQRDVAVILDSNQMDFVFCTSPHNPYQSPREVARYYVRSWATGIWKRKPFPGFHPGIYQDLRGISAQGADPFAEFIRTGSPSGPWLLPVIRDSDTYPSLKDNVRVVLHLHIYYPELLPDILTRLNKNSVQPDLVISVPSRQCAEEVALQLESYAGVIIAIEAVPNRGRDIGPFLTAFGPKISRNYDFVGHIHTKKSLSIQDPSEGTSWYKFILENILGGASGAMMDRILGYMSEKTTIGMVFPDDPNVVGWGENKSFAVDLAERLKIPDLPEHFTFPVGSMFWARVDSLKYFWELELEWEDYPEEPLSYDGSILHAIERLLPLGLVGEANQCALTNVKGISR